MAMVGPTGEVGFVDPPSSANRTGGVDGTGRHRADRAHPDQWKKAACPYHSGPAPVLVEVEATTAPATMAPMTTNAPSAAPVRVPEDGAAEVGNLPGPTQIFPAA